MSEDLQQTFFSKNNQDFLYEQTKEKVARHKNYDINKSKSFQQNFQKMALLVYNSTNNEKKNLVTLNNTLVEKSTSYFLKLIDRKMSKSTSILNSNDLKSGLTNVDSTNMYMPKQLSGRQVDNPYLNNQNSNQQNDILPFTLNNEFQNQINSNESPLYINNPTINSNQDPQKLVENFNNSRDDEIKRYQKQLEELNSKRDNLKFNNLRPNTVQGNLNNTNTDLNLTGIPGNDFLTRNNKVDLTSINPLELQMKNEQNTNRMINTMEENQVSGNNVNKTLNDQMLKNEIHNIQVNSLIENQPQFIEKEHYITINSFDRNWEENDKETQYNFKVNFTDRGGKHANIQKLMKNILSIELINTNIPIDPIITLFDTRIYQDAKTFPYLLLHINEINGVFRGTNSNIDGSFAQLIFDKEHTSQVISNDLLTTINGGADFNDQFQTQFKKGFYRYIPSFFEKKQFYNQPLASLGQLSIRLTDPDGNFINNQPDTLTINNLETDAITNNHEIDGTKGFPNTDSSTHNYIKITTSKHFSNRQFKIGDRICIKNIITTNNNKQLFVNYLNRDEGHVIINLEEEDSTDNTARNKSFINQIFISRPGDLDSDNESLDTNTSLNFTNTIFDDNDITFTNAKLINKSLQTNLTLKVVTREVDVQDVIKPQNI